MTYQGQRDAIVRTRQDLLVLGVRECQNFYATTVQQRMQHTDEFDDAVWTKTSLTVTPDNATAPDGSLTADTVTFDATNDSISQVCAPVFNVSSKAFTASIWMRVPSGSQTVTIYIHNLAETEGKTKQVTLTTTWQRFFVGKKFSATPTDNAVFKVIRTAGDNATAVQMWRANLSRNVGDLDIEVPFPSTRRITEASTDLSVQVSRCSISDNGDGARCFYSRPTCQSFDDFNAGHTWEDTPRGRGIREYRLCRQNAPFPIAGVETLPYLVSAPVAAQEIDPERALTLNERAPFEFEDDSAPGLWNPRQQSEGALVNTATGVGTFWRRWAAIYRNYGNPEGYLKRLVGFVEAGATEADFQPRGTYLIRNYETSDRRITLTCADRLKLTRKSIPAKINQTNFIQGPLTSGATTITAFNASEITTPTADYTPVLIIDPGTAYEEKVNVTAIDLTTRQLTVQRGRWGTAAVAHAMTQIAFKESAEFGTERSNPSLEPLGENGIDIIIRLYKYAGLSASDIDSATLLSERDTWLPTSLDVTTGTHYGPLLRRSLTQITDVETLARELRALTLLFLWVDNNQKLTGKVFAPVAPGVTLTTLDDDSNFVAGTISVDDNDESRVSRCLIAYHLPPSVTSASVAEDFLEVRVDIDVDSEEREYYGEPRLRVLLDQWVMPLDFATAAYFTSHIISRFRHGARMMSAALEIKDDDVELGDFVQVNTKHVQDSFGNNLNSIMQIMKKRAVGDNRFAVDMLDTGLYHRYAFYSAPGLPDYPSATTAQRQYGFYGDANGKVGSPLEYGYYYW